MGLVNFVALSEARTPTKLNNQDEATPELGLQASLIS